MLRILQKLFIKSNAKLPLPQDLLIKIFLLLPFESVVACKRVSKEWKDLINDPNFFNRYLTRKSMAFFIHEKNINCVFIRQDRNKVITTNDHQCPTVTMRPIITINDFDRFYSDNDLTLISSSTSSRIACVITEYNYLVLYDLFTGESHFVKNGPLLECNAEIWLWYGFGYDSSSDDYKILVVSPVGKYIHSSDMMLCWVYSFRNCCWEAFNCSFPATFSWSQCHKQGVFVNGVLHWIVYGEREEYDRGKLVIATLDLNNCRSGLGELVRFGEIALPIGDHWFFRYLTELDGKLCYCTHDRDRFDVWVMKEYGVGESWAKLLRLDHYPSRLRDPFDLGCIKPITVYDERGVLFVCQRYSRLFWYDVEKKDIEVIDSTKWKKKESYWMQEQQQQQQQQQKQPVWKTYLKVAIDKVVAMGWTGRTSGDDILVIESFYVNEVGYH